jgi:hypothetical protein
MNADQQREFFSRTFTIQGRVFYPNLLTPETLSAEDVAAGKNPKYKCMFAWPKTAQVNAKAQADMFQFLTQAKETLHPSVPWTHFVNPIKDFDTYVRQDGKGNPEFTRGCYWINPTTSFQIPLVGPDRQPVFNEAEVYSGRNCLINISFYNITGVTKDGKTTGKRGLGVNMHAVMLLEGGAHEGGFVQADPNQIFGNFVVDSGLIAQGGVAQQPIQQAAANPFGGAVSADQLPPPLPSQQAANPFGGGQVQQAANPFGGGQVQQQQQVGGINMPQQGFGQAIVGNTNNRNPFGV